jgi:hypothetical protein
MDWSPATARRFAPPLDRRPRRAATDRWRRVAATIALLLAGASLPSRWARAEPSAHQTPEFQLDVPPLIRGDERPLHVGRAALETLGLMLGASVWYWRDLNFNARDWDLRWDQESWARKLTLESVGFDQNLFQTNAVSHSRAGFAHYQIARGNGFGVGASLATTVGTSLLWEFVAEFKEQPSINDMAVNTVAGIALGEPFYQLGEFFLRSRPNLLTRGLAGAFNPVGSMNDWVDGRQRSGDVTNFLGFTNEVAHRFALTASYDKTTFDEATERRGAGIGATAALVTLRGYGRPGKFGTWIAPGSWTSIAADLTMGDRGVAGGSLLTRTALLGRYTQAYRATVNRGIAGHGTMIGLGSAFDYESRGRPGGADYLAVMNIAGPVFEFLARTHALRLQWTGELYGDFAMVKSLAFEGRLDSMPGDVFHPRTSGGRIPGVLGARGYYYALGITAGTRVELDFWGWDLGAEVRGDHFDSISGFDRFREEMIDEYELVDRRLITRAWAGVRPWSQGPRLFTGLTWRYRHGTAELLNGEHLDLRLDIGASLLF